MAAVCRKFTFDSAHLIPKHKGKCKNLHGHTYLLELIIYGEIQDNGMVLDYGDIKMMADRVIEEYDHSFLVNRNTEDSFELEALELCRANGKKIKLINGVTTTENIAVQLMEELPFKSMTIRLHETPNTFVEIFKNKGAQV